MSTRSMTLIAQPYSDAGKYVPLYRHCDGYPAGASLAEVFGVLRHKGDGEPQHAEAFLGYLLNMRYDKAGGITFGTQGDPVYRAATWQPEDQGDLEFVYVVSREGSSWTITVHTRKGWDDGSDDWRTWPSQTYTPIEFDTYVIAERAEMTKRESALHAASAHR
jgi:hypothetical protein